MAWSGTVKQPERVKFHTPDGWAIVGLYHAPRAGKPVAVMVHGVGAGKGEWDELSRELWKLGFGTLAIDLRGHGESTRGPEGARGYASFDAANEWPKAQADVDAAVGFLNRRGVPAARVGIIGGSIGANLGSRAAADLHLPWAVLLSPGLDYRGVGPASLPEGRVCLAASPSDPYPFQSALALANQGKTRLLEAPSGHGAQMLRDPAFLRSLIDCIKQKARTGVPTASARSPRRK